MLEKFSYTNSFNERLDFGQDCLFVNENDLRDFAWQITSRNNKISGFKKGIVQKTIPVILKCSSEDEGIFMRNRIFEVFEKDILANKHGKIHIGNYYLRCFITGIKKAQYLISKQYMVLTLTVQTDYPAWVKETTTMHSLGTSSVQTFLDYPHDFPFDFRNPTISGTITNIGITPCNFISTIFGEVGNPAMFIGNHKYSVDVYVGVNEHLTIDSVNKTVILTRENGEQVNCFNDRDRDFYIFEKIPTGTIPVTSMNERLQFNLTLLEERSEPKWI
jgi:hypothetical protein